MPPHKLRSVSRWGLLVCDIILAVIAWFNIVSMKEAADLPAEYRLAVQGPPHDSAHGSPSFGIFRIDGNEADSSDLLRYDLCKYASGDSVTVTDVRGNIISGAKIRLVSRYSSFELGTIAFVGAVFLLFGVYIIVQHSAQSYAGVLHALTVGTALMILYDWGSLKPYSVSFNALRWFLYDAAIWILPTLFFHFSFKYPNEKKKYRRFFIAFFYVVSVLGVGVSAYYLVQLFFYGIGVLHTHYLEIHDQVSDVFLMVGLLCAVANLEHSALTIQDAYDRKRIYWVLLGISFGPLVYVFLILVPRTMLGYELVSLSMLHYTLLMAPLMFYLAIRKAPDRKVELSM
jgi:hypothetical protein